MSDRMARRLWTVAAPVALLCLILVVGCGKRTSPVPAATSPERIISLAPSLTEVVFALGLGDRVVGVTDFCAYPPEVEALPHVGGYVDANLEAIVVLKPDLVVLFDGHRDVADKLAGLGIGTLTVQGGSVAAIYDSIGKIGAACGVQDRSTALTKQMKDRVEAVRRTHRGCARPRTMISFGRGMGSGALNDIYIAGEDEYFSELLDAAGGENAYSGAAIPFPKVSAEGVIELNPDVIVDLCPDLESKGLSLAEIRAQWQELTDVSAVASGRVYVVTESFATIPGPRFPALVERLASLLHPDDRHLD